MRLFLFAALSGGTRESTVYDSYKQAWHAGHAQNLPVLVILNPAEDANASAVDLDWLRRSATVHAHDRGRGVVGRCPSSPDAAAQAAQSELGAGAQLILGPVFANDVRTASAAAKSAGRPMIAFSTDVTVAAPGVYLLSFLIQGYVDRILQYAVSTGKKSFGIMAPQNDYGNVAAQRFQEMAGNVNAQVVVTARYSTGQIATAAGQVAAVQGQIDALFIADQADGMAAVASALASANIKTKLLGTGVWNDARVLKLPQMQGAWFPAPDNSGFDAFAQRYQAKFNSEPARLATLAYDAVTLAAALAHNGGADAFNQAALTNISGFNGADGVFRFHADGTNERGLAVMEIADDGAKVISPAPRSFAAG